MNVVQNENKELWHRHLGHMCKKGLEILAKKSPSTNRGHPLESCEDCLMGNQHKVSFKTSYGVRRRK
uniref:Retrovirus-related Pol polyprotein from transposon TNT 1-94 n=1 Tax=Cajanus cajan TaxID=3821 RepID=A0A151RN85_CAJCA|nr:Retrovirus-related Pol polyprotein from transposon TNT 1-94 [Cajanus cajan]